MGTVSKYKYNITEICMTFLNGRRFYSVILAKMVKQACNKIKTAAVAFNSLGKVTLFYNEDYLLGLPLTKAQGILEHEVLHIFFRHLTRHLRTKDDWLNWIYNVGEDVSINQHIKDLPDRKDMIDALMRINPKGDRKALEDDKNIVGVLYPKTYDLVEGRDADYYIEELKKKFPRKESCPTCGQAMEKQDSKDQDGQGQGQGKDQDKEQGQDKCPTCGQTKQTGIDSHDLWDKVIGKDGEVSDVKDHDIDPEFEVQNVVLKAIKECKDFGGLPAFVQKEINKLKVIERHSWKHELKIFVNSVLCVSKRLSQKRVNRRFTTLDYILPGKKKSRRPKLLLVRDTSGSMANDKLQQELTNEMLHISKFASVHVADCDTDIHQVYEIHKAKDFKAYIGGGGTSFVKAFEKAKELKVEGIIYLTDTQGEFPERNQVGKYAAKTIWVTFDQEKVTLPFGKHVNIETTGER